MAGPPSSMPSKAAVTTVMPYSPVFLKIRSIAFGLISFISLLCIVILCIKMYLEWDISVTSERSLMSVMLVIYALTDILLPILIILAFRPWLDAARLLLLLMMHIGPGVLFTFWFASYQTTCPSKRCELFNIFILVMSWVVSTLLVVYGVGLAVMLYRRSRLLKTAAADEESDTVVDDSSFLPIMTPPPKSPLRPVYSDRRFTTQTYGSYQSWPPQRTSYFPAMPTQEKRMTVPLPSPAALPSASPHMSWETPYSEKRLTPSSVRYGYAV